MTSNLGNHGYHNDLKFENSQQDTLSFLKFHSSTQITYLE